MSTAEASGSSLAGTAGAAPGDGLAVAIQLGRFLFCVELAAVAADGHPRSSPQHGQRMGSLTVSLTALPRLRGRGRRLGEPAPVRAAFYNARPKRCAKACDQTCMTSYSRIEVFAERPAPPSTETIFELNF